MTATLIILLWLLFFHMTIGVGVTVLMLSCIGYVVIAILFFFMKIP